MRYVNLTLTYLLASSFATTIAFAHRLLQTSRPDQNQTRSTQNHDVVSTVATTTTATTTTTTTTSATTTLTHQERDILLSMPSVQQLREKFSSCDQASVSTDSDDSVPPKRVSR